MTTLLNIYLCIVISPWWETTPPMWPEKPDLRFGHFMESCCTFTVSILINAHIRINGPLPSLERNINCPKTSNNRPSPGLTWIILHYISGNTYFSIAKFGQCLFNQEMDFLSVRNFSIYGVLRRDVHTPTSSPPAFGCTPGHTSWDSENLNSMECA